MVCFPPPYYKICCSCNWNQDNTNQPFFFLVADETQRHDDASGLPLNNALANNGMAKQDFASFLDDPMLIEFGWSIGDDIFSPAWPEGNIAPI